MQINLLDLADQCGCGAKLPAAELRELLKGLPAPADPNLLVGPDTFDDGAVYRVAPGCLIVQTADFFPPVASDPRTFGRIAAANALSDVYAMGGRPVTALSLMCVPKALPLEAAGAILAGAIDALTEAGAVLVGGHTLNDPQLKFGLSVTGVVEEGCILTNAAPRPGDVLVLTKPLGAGLTINAAKARLARQEDIAEANRWMCALNAAAATAALAASAHAATDVTGFGLLGHAWQMAKAGGVKLVFRAARAPVMARAEEFASMGLVPGGAYANRKYLEGRAAIDPAVALARQDVLFDPQTSGGLLVALPPAAAGAFRHALAGRADCLCEVVGRVEPGDQEPRIVVEP